MSVASKSVVLPGIWPVNVRVESLPAALCDAISGGFFLVLWLSPMAFGPEGVRVAFMLFLVEFLLMHAAGVLGAQQARGTGGCLALIGFSGGYLLFFVVAAASYESSWPLVAFAWLVLGKLFGGGKSSHEEIWNQHRRNGIWMLSFLAWLGLALLVMIMPVPQLGMQPEIMAQVDAFGVSGDWVDHPQKLMAFGTAYFMLLATAKLTDFNVLDFLSARGADR